MPSLIVKLLRYLRNPIKREQLALRMKCLTRKRFVSLENVKFDEFCFDVPDAPSFYWQYVEIFNSQIYAFPASTPDPIIYDCGANVGVSVAYFKSRYPSSRIEAFEPDPAIYAYLKKNLARNHLLDRVTLRQSAVWIHENGISFLSDGADGGHISSKSGAVMTPSVSLRNLLEQESRVDFLKMDVEGAEGAIIPDIVGVLDRVENFFVEYHCFEQTGALLGDILNIFERAHFKYCIMPLSFSEMQPFWGMRRGHVPFQVNIFAQRQVL